MKLFDRNKPEETVDVNALLKRLDEIESVNAVMKGRIVRLEREMILLKTKVDSQAKRVYITKDNQ